jgi:hypothetical protein
MGDEYEKAACLARKEYKDILKIRVLEIFIQIHI